MDLETLFRPFDMDWNEERSPNLGSLYDIRKGKIIPNFMFWSQETVQKNVNTTPNNFNQWTVTTSNSHTNETITTNFNANAGGICEGVPVVGSGSYKAMKETNSNDYSIVVTFRWLTEHEELVNLLHIKNTDHKDVFYKVLDDATATHVVSRIDYGIDLVIKFAYYSNKIDERSKISGELKVALKDLLNGKSTTNRLSMMNCVECQFTCDVLTLDKLIYNYEDVKEVCARLPARLASYTGKGSPKKVYLYPLSKMNDGMEQLLSSLQCQNERPKIFLKKALDLEMTGKFLAGHPMCDYFKKFYRNIQDFNQNLGRYIAKFVKIINEKAHETDTALNELEESNLNSQQFEKWLNIINQELNILSVCVRMLKENQIEFVSSPSIAAQNKYEHRLCFSFGENSLLDNSFSQCFPVNDDCLTYNEWYTWCNDETFVEKLHRQVQLFKDFVTINGLKGIVVPDMKERHGAASGNLDPEPNDGLLEDCFKIYLYESKSVGKRLFQPPSPCGKPSVRYEKCDNGNKITITWKPPDFGSNEIIRYKIWFRVRSDYGSDRDNWQVVITDNAIPNYVMHRDEYESELVFKIQGVTSVGDTFESPPNSNLALGRNLIKNDSGQEEFTHWTFEPVGFAKLINGLNTYQLEKYVSIKKILSLTNETTIRIAKTRSCFLISSFTQSQIVDLTAKKVLFIINTEKPPIIVSLYYCFLEQSAVQKAVYYSPGGLLLWLDQGVTEAPKFQVSLLDSNKEIVAHFSENLDQNAQMFTQISHKFVNYKENVNYVFFKVIGGGSKLLQLTKATVLLEASDNLIPA